MKCRLCESGQLSMFLDLGFTPPADRFITAAQLDEPEIYYPLKVVRCDRCMFVQLNYVVAPEILYQEDYPYEASTTQTGRIHFDGFAGDAFERCRLREGDLAVDIGSNVGVLLQGFKKRGCRVLGVDPAANIARIAEARGIPTLPVFFTPDIAQKISSEHGRAGVITASNVFAHIDDLHSLMNAVDILLDDDGVFIVEAPYLKHLLEKLEYDTIYHEHVSYLSLTPLAPFFRSCGFELFDVLQADIHGGSIRLFISRQGRQPVRSSVTELMAAEKDAGIHSMDHLNAFAQRVSANREALVSLLRSLKHAGKKIAGLSAPAKGMTLLNYCRIDATILDFVTEKSALKIGKYTPGTHLPVLPDTALIDNGIDYALLLAWNFKEEIIHNLSDFSGLGGRFIVPIPEPVVI